MAFRLEVNVDGNGTKILCLSGRVEGWHLEELKTHALSGTRRVALDLAEVKLVDVDVVRFLRACETRGIELRHCPAYIRVWIRAAMPE